MTHVNIAEARAFLQRLDPEASAFTFQTYSDRKRRPDPFARITHGDPGNGIMDDLGALNAKGAGVFVTVNATDLKGREASNVVEVRAVFVDLDGAPLAPVLQAGLEPHIVCESSPGKYHAYWLCDDCPLDQFTPVQLALARKFGGDPRVHDLPRVLRVPGYVHQKAEPFVSHVLEGVGFSGPPYSLAEIVGTLGLDLARRDDRHERVAIGAATIGEGGRNDHLFRLGRSMAKRGLSREAVAAALAAENLARCTPPVDDEEVEGLSKDVFSRKDAPTFRQAGPAFAPPQTDEADASDASREAAEQLLRHPTEQNVALAFAALHADRLRYCAERDTWYQWDRTRWRPESTGLALDFAARLARQSHHEGKAAPLRASFARGVETLARVHRAFAVRRDVFDADPFLLATPGGTFDLASDTLRPARQEDYLTRRTAVTPEAGTPALFLDFLRFAFDGDDAIIAFVQRAIGYSLTGDTRHECLFFGVGGGGNGKGTLFGAMTNILADYAHQAPLDMFLASRNEQHPTSLAALDGARFVVASEISRGRAWDDQKVKAVTGGDRVTAHFMRQDDFTFEPRFKLWIAANTRPRIRVVDDAWRRRLLLLPFDCKPETPDPTLKARLVSEYGRILAWAAEGCAEWRAAGYALNPPPRVTAASEDYLTSQDAMGDFIAERCEIDYYAWTSRKELLAAWREYAEALDAYVGAPADLYDRLQREINVVERKREGDRGFTRLRLKPPGVAS